MTTLNNKIPIAVVGGLTLFVLVVFASEGIVRLIPNDAIWYGQVILKAILILVSLILVRFALKLSWSQAGFRKPNARLDRWRVFGSGATIGALTTILLFITPAEGNPLVKSMNLIEFILIIVIWSSLAEEIFIRGLIQSYLQPFVQTGIQLGKIRLSIPVIVCAVIFGCLHLSLLFAEVDLITISITVTSTFLLGIVAGIFRERYESNIPAFLTHASFNIGAIAMGVILGVVYRIITGEFPPH